jgi:hypothetical protein
MRLRMLIFPVVISQVLPWVKIMHGEGQKRNEEAGSLADARGEIYQNMKRWFHDSNLFNCTELNVHIYQ